MNHAPPELPGRCRRTATSVSCLVAAAIILCAGAPASGQEEDEFEVQALREQLTEREDENRVEDPTVVDLFGRPLSLLGQYEITLTHVDRVSMGDPTNDFSRLFLEQELELEAFYTVHEELSFFAQVKLIQEEDLDSETPDDVSDAYAERGEMWIYAEELGGSPLSLEAGRLNFEDDRTWWWDEDLDAVRLIYEEDDFEIQLAVARELVPARSDRDFIEPDHEDVVRVITEASWDWSAEHALEFFVLSHNDRSRTEKPGEIVRDDREDESDADLMWLGLRASGAWEFEGGSLAAYWLDAGLVDGDESLVSTGSGEEEEGEEEDAEDSPGTGLKPGRSVVEEVVRQDVSGWGLDTGITWMFPVVSDPRVTLAYAMGSGDRNSENGTDRSYRQSDLQGNEIGFGGVQRFQGYGELLDPDLSNLSIYTVGVGCSLLRSSSIDLVYHAYRLMEPADSLRDSELDSELTGTDRDLGQGIDLVFAVEEWETLEFELVASAFRAGKAYGRDEGEWDFGGSFACRVAF